MKKRLFVLLNFVLVLSLVMVSPASAKKAPDGLQPGETVTFEQKVPVNIIFIGYNKKGMDLNDLRDQLPETYVPVVQASYLYGLPGRDLGLKYNFDYKFTFTENKFANNFFNYLTQIGTAGDPTIYQQLYNEQEQNVLDITGPVLYIDGPSVESWLASNLKVDQKSYTLVFINWYSRPDFKFHVYTKTDEPDPDTGHNFGLEDFTKMIAWGGTGSRLWFHDLSAGPEWNTDNWNVDEPDLNGDGVVEYRMPPVWEYAQNGFRQPGDLGHDLGLVARYVAINLLFTTSPAFDPLVTAPGVGGSKIVHINMFEDDPENLGTDWIDLDYTLGELASYQPYYNWQIELVNHNPIEEEVRQAFRIFAELDTSGGCWEEIGTPFAQLFCFFDQNRDQYIPAYGPQDYIIGVFAFNTADENMGPYAGLLGYADDNWMDGTQTYVFEFDTPGLREAGFGFSTTSVHEIGHHIGLSHPHDGYDSELGLLYGAEDEFYYAWVGDESDTVMSYLGLSNTFSEFDMDNLYRWEFAGYINWANNLLDDILAHPNAKEVGDNVKSAERYAQAAIRSFHAWDYLQAVVNARSAYEQLAAAASELGIEPAKDFSLMAVPAVIPPHGGDFIRPHE